MLRGVRQGKLTLVTSQITAWAAVAAAIFSLMNVALSNRLTRTSQVQQWRRDSVLKTITAFLDTARSLSDAYRGLAELSDIRVGALPAPLHNGPVTDDEVMRAHERCGREHERMQHLLAELELVASVACFQAGQGLFEPLDQPMMTSLRPGGPENKLEMYWHHMQAADEAREAFVLKCRTDLGVERGRRMYMSSRRRLR